jgi:hypothetical protein
MRNRTNSVKTEGFGAVLVSLQPPKLASLKPVHILLPYDA